MKKILNLILLLIFILFSACSVHNQSCISPAMKSIIIKWGDLNSKTGEIKGWQMDAKLNIQKLNQNSFKDSLILEKMAETNEENFCYFVKLIQDSLRSVQTLSVFTETSRFVEINNKDKNFQWRGVWNKEFDTYLSKGFRWIYDSLNAKLIVPNLKKEKKQ